MIHFGVDKEEARDIAEQEEKVQELTKRIEDHVDENRDVICRCIGPFLSSDVTLDDALSKPSDERLDKLLREALSKPSDERLDKLLSKASSKLGDEIRQAPKESWRTRWWGLKSKEQLQREKDIIDRQKSLRDNLKISRLIIQSYN